MSAADRIIRWTTAGAVLGVAAVAAVVSYEHASDLVRSHGEAGWTAHLIPLTVDGLITQVQWWRLTARAVGRRFPRWRGAQPRLMIGANSVLRNCGTCM